MQKSKIGKQNLKLAGEAGQTLVEAIVALMISVAIISAIAIAVVSSLNNSEFSKSQNQANQYAQEAMGLVRGIRDASWNKFVGYNNIYYCLGKNEINLVNRPATGCGQNLDLFSREVIIEHNSPFCTEGSRVTVNVSWNDSSCKSTSNPLCHQVNVVSCLGNINAVPIP